MINHRSLSYLNKIRVLNKTIGLRWVIAPHRIVLFCASIGLIGTSIWMLSGVASTYYYHINSVDELAHLDETYQSYEHILTSL